MLLAAGFWSWAACTHSVSVSPETPRPTPLEARIPVAITISIPARTATHVHSVRSIAAGSAHRWDIEVGKAIAEYANAYLLSAFPPGRDAVIQLDLENFDVHDFEAHCNLRFTVIRDGRRIFQRTYHGEGVGYAARVMWGGAMAMDSSMRRTTDEALRSLFEQFLADARASVRTMFELP